MYKLMEVQFLDFLRFGAMVKVKVLGLGKKNSYG